MSSDRDDTAREPQVELRELAPDDPDRGEHVLELAPPATDGRQHPRARWTMPLLAAGAVAALVGGVAVVRALRPAGHHVSPGTGPTSRVTRVAPPASGALRCVITPSSRTSEPGRCPAWIPLPHVKVRMLPPATAGARSGVGTVPARRPTAMPTPAPCSVVPSPPSPGATVTPTCAAGYCRLTPPPPGTGRSPTSEAHR